jgi:hypothetical protein
MRFDTGIHPRQWHRGAWLLAFVLAALVLLLTHRPSGGRAFAMEPDPAPVQESPPPPDAAQAPAPGSPEGQGAGYVAEIVDSSYTVGPAEFFALDLPTHPAGAHAVHLFGTVTTKGKKDIVVRLFRSADYDLWLKEKSGRRPQAFWTSPRSGRLTLDQDLPAGQSVVMLLDNGYSIRTSKQVTCQLQLRYQRKGVQTFDTEGGGTSGPAAVAQPAPSDDNLPTPRSNNDEEMPAPPPPPPSGY